MKTDEVIVLLNAFEMEIKRLRIEQNKTLAGSRDSNLDFVQGRVNEMVKQLNKTPFKKYVHKFRFENLLSRMNVMKINFNRMYGGRDEKLSKVKKKLGLKQEQQPLENNKIAAREDITTVKLNNLDKEASKGELKRFFNEYVKVSEDPSVKSMKYDRFASQIENRLDQIKKKHGDASLQIKIVKEGGAFKIKTKAVKK